MSIFFCAMVAAMLAAIFAVPALWVLQNVAVWWVVGAFVMAVIIIMVLGKFFPNGFLGYLRSRTVGFFSFMMMIISILFLEDAYTKGYPAPQGVYLWFWPTFWLIVSIIIFLPYVGSRISFWVGRNLIHLFWWNKDNAPPRIWTGVFGFSLVMLLLFSISSWIWKKPIAGEAYYPRDHWWMWFRLLVASPFFAFISLIVTRIDDMKDAFTQVFQRKARVARGEAIEEEAKEKEAAKPAVIRKGKGFFYWFNHWLANLAADLFENLFGLDFFKRFVL